MDKEGWSNKEHWLIIFWLAGSISVVHSRCQSLVVQQEGLLNAQNEYDAAELVLFTDGTTAPPFAAWGRNQAPTPPP